MRPSWCWECGCPSSASSKDWTLPGLDLGLDILRAEGKANPTIEAMVRKGQLGVKSGKGFFDYSGRSEAEVFEKAGFEVPETAGLP